MADNKMLIDATHPEETRVVVLRNGRVEEFDYESAARKLLRGNIYLAKVTRVEPALQAAFVDYGGNRHGFLAFNEIHPDYYQIPMADRIALIEAEAAAEAEEEAAEDARAQAMPDRGTPASDNAEYADDTVDTNDDNDVPSPSADDDSIDTLSTELDAPATEDGIDAPAGPSDAETSKVIPEATQPDETLSEPVTTSDEDASLHADNDDEANSNEAANDDAHDDADEGATTGTSPAAEGSENDNSSPHEIGLVENQDVEEVDPSSTNNNNAEPVEEVGSEDALEELPARPRRSRRSYKIQEVIKRRQVLLIQVVKEERGNKGAALTTYLSLAGRYTVLMPNTARGGGVSRKISSPQDRKLMKSIAADLEVPEGMGLIIRTAGAARTKQEIRRDFEYLLRLWESVRELTLESTAPSLVYEEGNLIKRSIRDLYNKDVDEISVAGEHAYKQAKSFMRMLMPSHAKNVTLYKAPEPLFTRYQIERQLNAMFSPNVPLKSGGYLVINQTEALVAVDVNSGRSTREFSIEETALHTNLEAAAEVARQLKLRDLAGLIVIDFIDMDEKRNNRAVERRMKDVLRNDRARIQVGRISHFGLMEMSRQRMRTGVLEGSTTQCAQCQGTGIIRSTESIALAVLRSLEDAVMASTRHPLVATTTATVALYILNAKREFITDMEARLGHPISVQASDKIVGANFTIEKGQALASPTTRRRASRSVVNIDSGFEDESSDGTASPATQRGSEEAPRADDEQPRKRRRRRRGGRRMNGDDTAVRNSEGEAQPQDAETGDAGNNGGEVSAVRENGPDDQPDSEDRPRRSRRRGRRGGRRNRERREAGAETGADADANAPQPDQENASSDQGEIDGISEAVAISSNGPDASARSDVPDASSGDTPSSTVTNEADSAAQQHTSVSQPADMADAPASSPTDITDAEPQPKPRKPRRRATKRSSPPKVESETISAGSGSADQENTDAPSAEKPSAQSKPARTGWWQRRILGED